MTSVTVDRHDDDVLVPFSDLAEGEWFFYPTGDGLGVKVDGRGFYPTTGKRGAGFPDTAVHPVEFVNITFD